MGGTCSGSTYICGKEIQICANQNTYYQQTTEANGASNTKPMRNSISMISEEKAYFRDPHGKSSRLEFKPDYARASFIIWLTERIQIEVDMKKFA